MHFVAGLDLGQSADYSALAIVEAQTHEFLEPTKHVGTLCALRHLHRWELHTPYPTIVADLKALLDAPPLNGRAQLVVDGTGVGRPVVDLLHVAGLYTIPVSITAGAQVTHEQGWYGVPKRELVSTMAVAFEGAALLVAEGLPLAPVLLRELRNFKAKISLSGTDTYEAWREQDHDDLVLATALAVWWARRSQPNLRWLTWGDVPKPPPSIMAGGTRFRPLRW
jgi:hypothetical protein